MAYKNPKTGEIVTLAGDAGAQNIAANKLGYDYVANPWNGTPTVNTPADIAFASRKIGTQALSPTDTVNGNAVGAMAPGVAYAPNAVPAYNGVNPATPYVPEKILPHAGFTINESGVEVPLINRTVRSGTGTDQNVITPGASSSTSSYGGGVDNRTQAEKDAQAYLDQPIEKPKTATEIANERTLASKDRIQALNDYYATQKANLAPVNELRSREANAQAVLRGLSGSNEATNLAVGAETKNAAASNAIAAEQQMKLMDIYTGIQDFADKEAIRQKEVAIGTAKDVLARGATARAEATKHLEAIAKDPTFNLDTIKAQDPNTYNALAQSVGGEAYMRGIVSTSRPQNTIVGTPQRIGDYMVQIVKKPDGTVFQESVLLPAEVLAGQKTVFQKTDNGTFSSADGGKTYTLLKDSMKPKTTVTISKDLIRTGDQKLSATRGPDGYVDPNVYKQAFTDWVNGTDTHAPIGTAKEFLANFPPKNYVNPANTELPTYLMPTGTAKKTSSTTTAKARF